jgi:hypothetical protein
MSSSSYGGDFAITDVNLGGSGCPVNSASATFSPDGKTLSILFDEYYVEAGGDNRKLERKNCNVAIGVHVPQGMSVSVFKVDFRGYVMVPADIKRKAYAQFNVEYFFAGQRGPKLVKKWQSKKHTEIDEDFLLSDLLVGQAMVWSACGADTTIRANTSIRAKTNKANDEVYASVDSVDVRGELKYHLQWKKCRRHQ